jgi:hypothetical protein
VKFKFDLNSNEFAFEKGFENRKEFPFLLSVVGQNPAHPRASPAQPSLPFSCAQPSSRPSQQPSCGPASLTRSQPGMATRVKAFGPANLTRPRLLTQPDVPGKGATEPD